MRQSRVPVVSGTDGCGSRDHFNLCVHHIHWAAVAELHVHEGHAHVEAVVAGKDVYGRLGVSVASVTSMNDRDNSKTSETVDGMDQRAHLFIERRLRNHGLHGDKGEGVAMDYTRVVSLVVLLELSAWKLWKPIGAHAECLHRQLIYEGAVVGVLHDQRAVGHSLTQFAHGGEAILFELVRGPPSNHLDPVALRRSLCLLTQHG